MLMLLDDTYQVIKTFKTEVGLFLHLQENLKNMDEQSRHSWNFCQYSHKLLAPFVKEMQGKSFVDMARQACQREEDLIVMCIGDEGNPSLFLLTPDLDIDALQNEWCKLFCKAQKMYIVMQ